MTINLTDPANHPANGPLTVERITRLIAELQRSLDYQNGGDMAYVIADAIKGLEELLVSREAENVIQPSKLDGGENCWSCGKYFTYEQHSECDGYCPHCNSPVDLDDEEDQQSKVVPTNPTEEMISNAWREAIGKCDHETIRRIYSTMLAAAPQEAK